MAPTYSVELCPANVDEVHQLLHVTQAHHAKNTNYLRPMVIAEHSCRERWGSRAAVRSCWSLIEVGYRADTHGVPVARETIMHKGLRLLRSAVL